jgi:hypothetical protein
MGMEKILKWLKKELKSVWKIILALLTIWGVYEYGYKHGKDICESELGVLNKQYAILKDSLIFNAQIVPSSKEVYRTNLRKGTANPILDGQAVVLYRNVRGKDLTRKAEIQIKETDPKELKINQTGITWLAPGEHTSFTVESATAGYDILKESYFIDFLGFYDDIEKDLAKIVTYYKTSSRVDPQKEGSLILKSTILRKGRTLGILKGAVQVSYKNIEMIEGRRWPFITLNGKGVRQFRSAFRSAGDIIPFYQEKNFYALSFLGFVDTLTSEDIKVCLYKIRTDL